MRRCSPGLLHEGSRGLETSCPGRPISHLTTRVICPGPAANGGSPDKASTPFRAGSARARSKDARIRRDGRVWRAGSEPCAPPAALEPRRKKITPVPSCRGPGFLYSRLYTRSPTAGDHDQREPGTLHRSVRAPRHRRALNAAFTRCTTSQPISGCDVASCATSAGRTLTWPPGGFMFGET